METAKQQAFPLHSSNRGKVFCAPLCKLTCPGSKVEAKLLPACCHAETVDSQGFAAFPESMWKQSGSNNLRLLPDCFRLKPLIHKGLRYLWKQIRYNYKRTGRNNHLSIGCTSSISGIILGKMTQKLASMLPTRFKTCRKPLIYKGLKGGSKVEANVL